MPDIKCPIPGCDYTTGDVEAQIVVQLLQLHQVSHCTKPAATAQPNMKIEKVKRPTISTGGSSEEWSYFLTRWEEYKAATKVSR